MIWIDVTARAARQVRALVADRAEERLGLRVAVARQDTDVDGPQVRLSLSSHRAPDDLVLPRFGFDVLVHDDDADQVDGLRIDFVVTPGGSGFVVDRLPRPRAAPLPALPPPGSAAASPPETGDAKDHLTGRVRRALDDVRPVLRADGGDVELVAVDNGVAYLRLEGACSGCSAALLTLTSIIERALLAAVPELTRTVQVA
jgi:iron-sulfur cluster assembly protein